jgi:hypothetical protein
VGSVKRPSAGRTATRRMRPIPAVRCLTPARRPRLIRFAKSGSPRRPRFPNGLTTLRHALKITRVRAKAWWFSLKSDGYLALILAVQWTIARARDRVFSNRCGIERSCGGVTCAYPHWRRGPSHCRGLSPRASARSTSPTTASVTAEALQRAVSSSQPRRRRSASASSSVTPAPKLLRPPAASLPPL